MGSKLKGDGVEFPDGTTQTTAAEDNLESYIYTENSTAPTGYSYTESSSEVVTAAIESNLRWFHDSDTDLYNSESHATSYIYDEQNTQLIRVGGAGYTIQGDVYGRYTSPNSIFPDYVDRKIEFYNEDTDHSMTLNGVGLTSKEAIRLGWAGFWGNGQEPTSAQLPTFGANSFTGAGYGKRMLIYNNNLYIFGGQGIYSSYSNVDAGGFPFGKVDLSNNTFSLLSHPDSSLSSDGYTTKEEFIYPVAFFEYSGDLYVLVDNHDEVYYELYKYTISTDTWSGPQDIWTTGGLQRLAAGSSDYDSRSVASVTTLNVNDDIYFIEHGRSGSVNLSDNQIRIGVYPKSSLVNIFNTGTQDSTGAVSVLGSIDKYDPDSPTAHFKIMAPAVCYDGADTIIIHGGYRSSTDNSEIYHQGTIYKWSISKKTGTRISSIPVIYNSVLSGQTPTPMSTSDSDSRYSRRSFHDIIPIQGYLLIFGGLHNQNADSTSSLGQFASAGKVNYLTNHLGDTVISETKTLYLHKRDQSSVDSTSLLVQENAEDIERLRTTIAGLEEQLITRSIAYYSTNLFLDRTLISNVLHNNNAYYGPSTQSGMNHTVAAFENFKTNTTYTNSHSLKIYSGDSTHEILISDLLNYNSPTGPISTNSFTFQYDNEAYRDGVSSAYFVGNDLVIFNGVGSGGGSQHVQSIYRIDIIK